MLLSALFLFACSSSLNITTKTTTFMLNGTQTTAVIGFDPSVDTFTFLWYSNGRDNQTSSTVAAVGITKHGTLFDFVYLNKSDNSVTSTGIAEYITNLHTINFSLSSLTSDPSQPFTFSSQRVYDVRVLIGVTINNDFESAVDYGQGTFHTYTTTSVNTSIDRNLGRYLDSTVMPSLTTANVFNYTLYASLVGNYITGTINVGYVAWSYGSVTSFQLWTGIQIGSTDFIAQQIDTQITDCYQNANLTRILDIGLDDCENNVKPISMGKGNSSGNLYQYSHFSRKLLTGDLKCDKVIAVDRTKLCYVWKDGDKRLQDLQGAESGRSCTTFNYSAILQWLIFPMIIALY